MAGALKWNHVESERLVQTPIFDLLRKRARAQDRERDFFVLEAPAWVNIIPLTRSNEVVMVRQYRHGIDDFTLEIPGGMVDPEDADPMAAARRELLEETGYESGQTFALGRVHPNPAIQGNFCYSYLALECRAVGVPTSDGVESTAVELHPLSNIPTLIASGRITHALVIDAFALMALKHGSLSLERVGNAPSPFSR